MVEYEAACTRPEHQLASGLSGPEIAAFLDAVAAMVEPVPTYFLWWPLLRDPADEMVLEAAIGGQAEAIVTFNLRAFQAVPEQFGIDVLMPAQALKRIVR